MTIGFLDEQVTGRGQARRSPRSHATPSSARRSSSPGEHAAGGSADPVVRPLRACRSTVGTLAAAAPAATGATVAQLPRHSLRLTRRGRIVFGAVLVLIVLTVFSLGRLTAGADASAPPLRVTVSAGDTLWSIAEQADPGSDPRDEVDRIVAANHLATSSLIPGTVLVVPRG